MKSLVPERNISHRIVREHKGDLHHLKSEVNAAADHAERNMHLLNHLVETLGEGQFSCNRSEPLFRIQLNLS